MDTTLRTALATAAVASALTAGGTLAAGELITSSAQVKSGVLEASDLSKKARKALKGKRGPAGPAGASGAQGAPGSAGAKGDKGDTGTVDTANFFTKTQSDDRFLGIGATAANAAQLGGTPAGSFDTRATNDTRYLGLTATAADSSQLGGRAASGYVRDGLNLSSTQSINGDSLAANTTSGFLSTIALGTLRGTCNAGATAAQVHVSTPAGVTANVLTSSVENASVGYEFISELSNSTASPAVAADHVTISMSSGNTFIELSVFTAAAGGSCLFRWTNLTRTP